MSWAEEEFRERLRRRRRTEQRREPAPLDPSQPPGPTESIDVSGQELLAFAIIGEMTTG